MSSLRASVMDGGHFQTEIEQLCTRQLFETPPDENKLQRLRALLRDQIKVKNLLTHEMVPVLEWTDFAGTTALHFACESGLPEVVDMLLEAKADINAKQLDGRTPLMLALSGDQVYHAKVIDVIYRKVGYDLKLEETDLRQRSVLKHGLKTDKGTRERSASNVQHAVNTHAVKARTATDTLEQQLDDKVLFTVARIRFNELYKDFVTGKSVKKPNNERAIDRLMNSKTLNAFLPMLDELHVLFFVAPMDDWTAQDVQNWVAASIGPDQANHGVRLQIVDYFRAMKFEGRALAEFSFDTPGLKQDGSLIFPEHVITSLIRAKDLRKGSSRYEPTEDEKQKMLDQMHSLLLYESVSLGRKPYEAVREKTTE